MVPFYVKLLNNIPKWFIGCIILLYLISVANYIVYTGLSGKYIVTTNDAALTERLKSTLRLQQQQHEWNKQDNITQSLRNVKIICWILTMPANHDTRAIHVKNTWGKRCDRIVFMSSQYNKSLPSIDLGINETRNNLWGKTKTAFKYVYDHHLNDVGWFMKADDDTYVVMENLRYFLSIYDPDEDAIWFGSRFKPYNKQGYMSGGGGYVLSRKALRLFVEKSLPNPSFCKEDDTGAEDAEMGKCLNNVGVIAGDSRDSEGRGRFFPFTPVDHVASSNVPVGWYLNIRYYNITTGSQCCSDLAISFHYIEPKRMYELEYLIYHLHPFGILHNDTFPPPLPKDKNSTTSRLLRDHFEKTRANHRFSEKYEVVAFIRKKEMDIQAKNLSSIVSNSPAEGSETTQTTMINFNSTSISKSSDTTANDTLNNSGITTRIISNYSGITTANIASTGTIASTISSGAISHTTFNFNDNTTSSNSTPKTSNFSSTTTSNSSHTTSYATFTYSRTATPKTFNYSSVTTPNSLIPTGSATSRAFKSSYTTSHTNINFSDMKTNTASNLTNFNSSITTQ